MSVRRLWEKCTRCGKMEPGRADPDPGVFVCRACMGETDGGAMSTDADETWFFIQEHDLDSILAAVRTGEVSVLDLLDAYEQGMGHELHG